MIRTKKAVLFYALIVFSFCFQCANAQAPSFINDFFCQDGRVFCTSGGTAFCSDPSFETTCFDSLSPQFINGQPDCCRDMKKPAFDCRSEFLVCPSLESGDPNELNLTITGGPTFPEIVTLPVTPDNLDGSADVAYRGSNPSFQIRLPTEFNTSVISVDVVDSTNIAFNNLAFQVTEDLNDPNIIVVGVILPENVALGAANLFVNLGDGKSVGVPFQVIDFLNIQASLNKKNTKLANVAEPVVNKSSERGSKKKSKIVLMGQHFVGDRVFVQETDGSTTFFDNDGIPFTSVNVLPSDLGLRVTKVAINKRGTKLTTMIRLDERLPSNRTDVVIVTTTPRGIVSEKVTITTSRVIGAGVTSGITCANSMAKPVCSNGKRAKCKGDFTPSCFPGRAPPDCCMIEFTGQDAILFNDCDTDRLFCPK